MIPNELVQESIVQEIRNLLEITEIHEMIRVVELQYNQFQTMLSQYSDKFH